MFFMLDVDIAIIGAGAAGLAAAVFAAEAAPGCRIAVVDGAKKPGAKILVSGGGRCNVTHDGVSAGDYFGGNPVVIRNVLRAFDHQRTIDWMYRLGVHLKLEETGKFFPTTDKARTVLDALLRRTGELGLALHPGVRVTSIAPAGDWFMLYTTHGEFARARRLVVATGGKSLPKSGSDGAGIEWMRKLGHTVVPLTPALAALVLNPGRTPGGRFAELAGTSIEARVVLWKAANSPAHAETGPVLFTHFGISGPAAMNLSRHIARWRLSNHGTPQVTLGSARFSNTSEADAWLLATAGKSPRRLISNALLELFPERYAEVLCEGIGGRSEPRIADLTREQRTELAARVAALPIEVRRDRGYDFAETTAGGVDLAEVDPRTMESRIQPGLFICGEMLDVDGRIGGYCFQWAWASGYLAGRGAAKSLGSLAT